MKITEALKIIQSAPKDTPEYRVFLGCGFTPLHLQTFVTAHLQTRLPARRIATSVGLFGDLVGSLENLSKAELDAVAIALEWQDLDARLGWRSAGSWGPAAATDAVRESRLALDRIARAVENLPKSIPVACSLPTLPLPPVFHTPGWQSGESEWALESAVRDFGARLLARPGFTLVNARRLEEDSPAAARYDVKQDLAAGLPYTLPHAAAVAAAFANLLAPPQPKKGIISDLDDTLWSGIAGEVGPDNVSWDLAGHSQIHGLYQKLLASLAEEGVLVAVASKNDPAVVKRAFERADILLPESKVFPFEVHWQPKSASVERILRTWNVGADSVVFVDDSAMELGEVGAAHPGVECIRFPKNDPAGAYGLLRRLRDLFGKPRISGEDAYRLESIRQGAAFQQLAGDGASPDQFLEQAAATVTLEFGDGDTRVLDLVNKTNQFNLNGRRRAEVEWLRRTESPDSVMASIAYKDKFGPLGKIAVIEGREDGGVLYLDTWVMSCRAFSRRIEHQCLRVLFDRTGASEIRFDFAATPKNGPTQEFFEAIAGQRPEGEVRLTRGHFESACPRLYHKVEETETSKSKLWTQSQPA